MVKLWEDARIYHKKRKLRSLRERSRIKTHSGRIEYDQRMEELKAQHREAIALYHELRGEMVQNVENLKLINQT